MAVIDGTDLILGRMAAIVAKRSLLGEKIDIINCEKIIIAGDKKSVLEAYKIKAKRGCPLKGPFFQKMPDRFTRRAIRGMLPYKQDKGIKIADLVIVNSCTVKHTTETNFKKLLRKLNQLKKKIVIAGCISQTDPEQLEEYSLVGTTQLNKIVEFVEETLAGNTVKILERSKTNPRLNLPKIRKNPIVEIIPISQGCLGNCSYCKTKAARFDLLSYDKKAILCQAKDAIKQGVKEIWLTSQDTAVYGKDIGSTLIDLLKSLIKLKGDFKIRLGMGNPNHLSKIIDKLLPLFKSKKLFLSVLDFINLMPFLINNLIFFCEAFS